MLLHDKRKASLRSVTFTDVEYLSVNEEGFRKKKKLDELRKFKVSIYTLWMLTMEGKGRCRNYVRMFVKGFGDLLIVDVIEHKVQEINLLYGSDGF